MLRVKEEILLKNDGIYYLEKSVYTGIIYFVEGENVTDIKVCENGQITKDYNNKYIEYKNYEFHLHAVDIWDILDEEEYIEDDSFQYFYKEKPYEGIYYEFKNGFLKKEKICLDGFFVDNDRQEYVPGHAKIKYYTNGEIKHLHLNNGFCEQWYDFNEKKEINAFYIRIYKDPKTNEKIELLANIYFQEDNKIHHITIEGNYLERITEFKEQIEFLIFKDRHFFKEKRLNRRLFIDGLNDNMFFDLNENDGFSDMEELSVAHNVNLSTKSFKLLKKLKKLKKFWMNTSNVDINIFKEIKKENPLCEIFLDRMEITL